MVRKTSFEEELKAKENAWFALSPLERLKHHQDMLKRIFGEKYHQPISEEARKVKIFRGNDADRFS